MKQARLTGPLALLLGAIALTPGSPALGAASACMDPSSMPGPKIGLALGGGGARGAAHIGVIKRLEELRVPVHYVAGTSMGSLVGGFYATGMTATELEQTVAAIDFETLFKDATPRKDRSFRRKRDDNLALYGPKLGVGPDSELLPMGAVHGQQISFLFESLTSARTRERDFDRLPIPYRAVAADIETGEPVVLAEGSLSLAMRSSMSVPGVFDPVPWGNHLLVDGGIANNLPIDVVRDLGADVIIAVEVGTPPAKRSQLGNMAAFVGQLSNLMIANNTRAQIASLGEGDLLLRPELGNDISSAGFDKASEAVVIGYAAAFEASDQLAQFSVSEADYARYRTTIESCVQGPATIDYVKVENRSRFSDEVIEKRLDIEPGSQVDNERLKAAIDRVYALGFLNLVRHEVVEEDGSTGVNLTVDQDARGTNFLEWGLDLSSDGDDAELDLRVGYLKTDLDEYGSELRLLGQVGDTPALMADLYKALGPELKWYVQPRIYAEWRDLTIYDDNEQPDTVLNIDQWGANLALQREFGNRSSILSGIRLYDGSISADVGEVPTGAGSFKGGEYFVGFDYDTVDDRYYPSSGVFASYRYLNADDTLGSDQVYDQSVLNTLGAKTWGRHTLIGNLRYATTLSGNAPYWVRFRSGGLFDLSGLQPDQINGDHYGFGMASWRYALLRGGGFFPAHIGISAEYGNATDERDEIIDEGIAAGSVYLGYLSPLGPLYWGVGFAEGGQRAYFLRIGNIFGRSDIAR